MMQANHRISVLVKYQAQKKWGKNSKVERTENKQTEDYHHHHLFDKTEYEMKYIAY